ncbi:hypothetical protein AX768_01700 [Burkholderia sp. PAMC 28687]|nr:hypothetical protein AX768_01700 [Burkholderia sp. PAMC 28687]
MKTPAPDQPSFRVLKVRLSICAPGSNAAPDRTKVEVNLIRALFKIMFVCLERTLKYQHG